MQGCSRISTSKLPMRDRKGGSAIVDYPVIFCNTIQVISLILNARKAQVITEKSYTAPDSGDTRLLCCNSNTKYESQMKWNPTESSKAHKPLALPKLCHFGFLRLLHSVLRLFRKFVIWPLIKRSDSSFFLFVLLAAAFCSFLSICICIFRSLDRSSGTLDLVPSLQVPVLMKEFL